MIKVAVIGIGNMGYHHARNYHNMKNVCLVAVVDSNSEVGNKVAKEFNCEFYNDHKKMLRLSNPDAVSVVVPTKLHKQIALDVIAEKKHLIIEKPIASTLEEGLEIINAAKITNIKLMIGHIERFNPAMLKIRSLIENNKLGEIVTLSTRRVGLPPPQIKDANVIINLAIHDIDIFSFLLGESPIKIYATTGCALTLNRYDHAELLIKYSSDAVGLIQVNWITPIKIRTLSVTGSKGYADLDYISQKLELYCSNYTREYDDFGDFVTKFGKTDILEIDVQREEPLKKELESFIESIYEDKEPLVSGEIGFSALKVALGAINFIKGDLN